MLVATFGPTTTWVGKTVTYSDGAFVLEGHGPISARDVFEYERQGHLVWSMDGIRAWVGAKAQEESGLVVAPASTGDWRQWSKAATAAQEAAPLEPEPEPMLQPAGPKQHLAADPTLDAVDAAPEAGRSAGLGPVGPSTTSVAAAADAEPVLTEADAEAGPTAASAENATDANLAETVTTVTYPAVSAEGAGPVLAAEPADVAGIAAAPDPIGDGFAGLGADDPARARAIEEAARDYDWARLKALYELQAWWLDEEGRDALQVTRLARRAELRALLGQGVTIVRVAAADEDTCEACRRVADRVMTIADALRIMPIPDASCAYKWCRCVWERADGYAPR